MCTAPVTGLHPTCPHITPTCVLVLCYQATPHLATHYTHMCTGLVHSHTRYCNNTLPAYTLSYRVHTMGLVLREHLTVASTAHTFHAQSLPYINTYPFHLNEDDSLIFLQPSNLLILYAGVHCMIYNQTPTGKIHFNKYKLKYIYPRHQTWNVIKLSKLFRKHPQSTCKWRLYKIKNYSVFSTQDTNSVFIIYIERKWGNFQFTFY